jgi:type VI secretion system secreted protein VgrG
MCHKYIFALIFTFSALCCFPSKAVSQLINFAVLAGSTVTNTDTPTVVTGDLGVSPGSAVTGFPPGTVVDGTIHAADAVAAQAQSDLTTLYNSLEGTACNTDLTGQDLGGKTLTPGVYCFSTSAQLTGTLTLDAQGNPNAVFLFKIGSTLTTASAAAVLLINDASSCGVFWQIGSSATLGTGTLLEGSIVALTSITLNTGAGVTGRLLARNGAVTLDDNHVALCTVGTVLPPPPPIVAAAIPTLSEWGMILLAGLLALSALVALRRKVGWATPD